MAFQTKLQLRERKQILKLELNTVIQDNKYIAEIEVEFIGDKLSDYRYTYKDKYNCIVKDKFVIMELEASINEQIFDYCQEFVMCYAENRYVRN